MAFSPFDWLLGYFSLDIGIDLGTANTLVHVKGKGIVIHEPSWVAINKRTREPIAIGAAAKEMIGRTPADIITLRPLRDGVISEFEITQAMLEYFIARAHQQSIVPVPRPRVVIGIPAGVTEVEKRAVYDAAMAAGSRKTYLIEEPVAAALGAGLPIDDVGGSMIVDIGGGTSEVAIMTMGGVVSSRSLRVAGDELDEDIIQYIRNKYNILIGQRLAEEAKITLGSAFPLPEEKTMTLRGRNLVTGLPDSIEISSIELRDALDETPPEILSDLMDNGVCLAGGGSLLQGLDQRLTEELQINAWLAEDPISCVARGAGVALEDIDKWKGLFVGLERKSAPRE